MQALPLISTALTAFGAYGEYKAGKEAKKESDARSDQEIYDERNRTNAEQAERRARAAASGIQLSGSPALFMNEAKKKDNERLNYMKRVGGKKADYLESTGTAGAIGSLSKIPSYWA